MAATDLGLNGRPRSFRKPRAANSAAIARRLSLPPFGFLRASASGQVALARVRCEVGESE